MDLAGEASRRPGVGLQSDRRRSIPWGRVVFAAGIAILIIFVIKGVWSQGNGSVLNGMNEVRDAPLKLSGGATRIYRKNPVGALLATVALFVAFTLVFGSKGRYAIVALAVAGTLAFVPLAMEFRRSIVVSPVGFEYKWRSGKIVTIPWADVEKIEETTTVYMLFPLRPIVVPAVRFILRSGSESIFPLDFPQRTEIVTRLCDSTSLTM